MAMAQSGETDISLDENFGYSNGERTENLAKSIDLTLQNILSPILDSEMTKEIFGGILIDESDRNSSMKEFYDAIQFSVDSELEEMIDRDDVFNQLNKLDAILKSWEKKDELLMVPDQIHFSSGTIKNETTLEKRIRERNIRRLKKEEVELREELKVQRERVRDLIADMELKKRQIECKLGTTSELIGELDRFLTRA